MNYNLIQLIIKKYTTKSTNNRKLLELTQQIINSLISEPTIEDITQSCKKQKKNNSDEHFLSKISRKEDGKIKRKRCHACYKNLQKSEGRKQAALKAKQIDTECITCGKAFCIPCFESFHRNLNK